MFSWAVLLLPFLEETSLYSQFDLSQSILDQVNEPQERAIPTFLCPTDAALGAFTRLPAAESASPKAIMRPMSRHFIPTCSCCIPGL